MATTKVMRKTESSTRILKQCMIKSDDKYCVYYYGKYICSSLTIRSVPLKSTKKNIAQCVMRWVKSIRGLYSLSRY